MEGGTFLSGLILLLSASSLRLFDWGCAPLSFCMFIYLFIFIYTNTLLFTLLLLSSKARALLGQRPRSALDISRYKDQIASKSSPWRPGRGAVAKTALDWSVWLGIKHTLVLLRQLKWYAVEVWEDAVGFSRERQWARLLFSRPLTEAEFVADLLINNGCINWIVASFCCAVTEDYFFPFSATAY